MPLARRSETATRILDIAERLVQRQGFNGFSYADLATELQLRKASLHHHYPTKAILGARLIARYQASFLARLDQIDRSTTQPRTKLARYVRLYRGVLLDDRMCLCGMLAAEFETLPAPMRLGVQAFFDANEAWLAQVLRSGRRDHALRFAQPPLQVARALVSSLEGAMLVARAYRDVKRFDAVASRLIGELAASN